MKLGKDISVLVVLVLVFVFLTTASALRKSPVADEAAHHVPTGYVFLKTGDFVYATDSPVLARCMAAFPLLFLDLELPAKRDAWAKDDRAKFSREFLYVLNKNQAKKIIFLARIPMILLGAFGGVFLFFWTRKRFGSRISVLASMFYFLSPNILAHARLATTDIAATVFIMCSVLAFWDFLESANYKRALTAGVFLGLAMMAKYSALLLLPAYLFLVIIAFFSAKKKKTSVFFAFLLCIAVSFLVLWAGYAFEFRPFLQDVLRPEGKVEFFRTLLQRTFPHAGEEFIDKWTGSLYTVPVPLRSYMLGVIGVLRHGEEGARTFFMGSWRQKGHPMYYILAFFIKTPIPVIISFFFGLFAAFRDQKRRALYAYLVSVIALFVVMSSRSNLQLGLRYILPVYPLVFIVAAAGLSPLFCEERLKRTAGTVLILWMCLVQVFIWPDYLSYFNELAAGPKGGRRYLRDSNIDWGQDLPALKDLMTRRYIGSVRLDYFGEGDPSLYGIDFQAVNEAERAAPRGFVYAISVNRIDGYAWTGAERPDAEAGHSILIYDLRKE